MMRNVYLQGEMGERFGTNFQVEAPSVRDALKCIEANHPSFRHYLKKCGDEEIGFTIDIADERLDYGEELYMSLQEGDITITPTPLGSKGAVKIIIAFVIFVIIMKRPDIFGKALGGGVADSWAVAVGMNWKGYALAFLAMSLANIGLMEMMSPDPATDQEQEQNYLFNGAQQNIIEGDPVPLLYGHLRVPGQPVGFDVAGVNMSYGTSYFAPTGESGDPEVIDGSFPTVEK